MPHADHAGVRAERRGDRLAARADELPGMAAQRLQPRASGAASRATCRRPQGPIRVASVLGDARDSSSRHLFVGGNAFMLRHAEPLPRRARRRGARRRSSRRPPSATVRQLQQDTATLTLSSAAARRTARWPSTSTSATSPATSCRPAIRRAAPWLHVTVRDARGARGVRVGCARRRAARSHGNDSDADSATFEPHYEEITQPDQVQIYEPILGDRSGRADDRPADRDAVPEGQPAAAARLRQGDGRLRTSASTARRKRCGFHGRRRPRALPHRRASASGPFTVEVELRYQPIGVSLGAEPGALRRARAEAVSVGTTPRRQSGSSVLVATARAVSP